MHSVGESSQFFSKREKRKLSNLKKKASELLLLSKKDPSGGISAVADEKESGWNQCGWLFAF